MGFKFQINDDVKFNHNMDLLTKADNYKPELHITKVKAKSIVELNDDPTKLEGVGIKRIGGINDLSTMKLTRDDQVIIDMGEHCVGKFNLHLSHIGSPMDSPLALKIKFAEMPNELTYKSEDYDGWLSKAWIQEEVVHLDQLPADLNLTRRYAFRYVQVSVIDTSPKWQVMLSEPYATITSSVSSLEGKWPDFHDDELNEIYKVGVKTLHDCMQDVFEDGPKRDRRLWLGDLRLQALANYSTFDNQALVKRCLYLFGAMTATDGRISANVFTNQEYVPDDTFMYDYSLFFITTLADFEDQHNDMELLSDLYPVAKKQWEVMEGFISEEGMVKPPKEYTVFVDWSTKFDKSTATQAITIYAIKKLIKLATQMDDPVVNHYQELCNQLVSYAKSELFDEDQGLFISGDQREVNIASQVWMVLADVLDVQESKEVMQKALATLFPVKGIATPYMYHHIDEALFKSGLSDEAIKLMKGYWGKMIDLGADTYWEAFEPEKPDYSPYGSPIVNSYCHAWSCTPVYLLKKYFNLK